MNSPLSNQDVSSPTQKAFPISKIEEFSSSSALSPSSTLKTSANVIPMHRTMTPLTNKQTSLLLRQSHPSLHLMSHDKLPLLNKQKNESISERIPITTKYTSSTSGINSKHSNGPSDYRMTHSSTPPPHPYLISTHSNLKQNVYVDPSTELSYPLNLCNILNKQESNAEDTSNKTNGCTKHNRHLLTGVGQYTRTVFKLKIYGIALYINEADIIGNYPLFQASVLTPGYTQEQQQEAFFKFLIKFSTRRNNTQ